jgi:hypothetical protein
MRPRGKHLAGTNARGVTGGLGGKVFLIYGFFDAAVVEIIAAIGLRCRAGGWPAG